jgi:hypothetical protein
LASKRTAAKVGLKVGRRVAPKVGKYAGKAALKVGKAQAKLVQRAMSSQEPKSSRFLKYGLFALVGFAVGALVARSRSDENGSSGGSTGHHTPDPDSPAGRRGETWGSGTPLGGSGAGTATGTGYQQPSDPQHTGAERDYSDPASGPLIGEQHDPSAGDVPEQQEEVENRIRTRVGEDPRTKDLPRINVEVNDGIVELRGTAPTEDAKLAVGEIAAETEGVREVRNLMQVS